MTSATLNPRGEEVRILIVRVGAMGDVLHAMPAVTALRTMWPSATVGWAIEPRWAALLRVESESAAVPGTPTMPLVDIVHPVPTRTWAAAPFAPGTLRSILALRNELRQQHYHIAVDLQGSIRSSVITRMSGAERVVGSADPRERMARWLYTECVRANAAHVIHQAVQIISAAVTHTLAPAQVPLPVDPEAEQWCERLLSGSTFRVVILAPSAGWGAKQWPAERYGLVARELAARQCRVLVNAVGASDPVAGAVVSAAGGAAERVVCSLAQLIALLRRSSLTIAGDTGPLHLAAALGRPVVALFGPTDPARTGPGNGASRVLRHSRSKTDHRRHAETETGLAEISTAAVLQAAADLLHSSPVP